METQENLLSIFVFKEAEGVTIWWNWGIQCGTSFAWPWVVLQPRGMRIFSIDFLICLQAVNSGQNTGLQDPLAGPHACSTSRFSPSGLLRNGYKKYLEIEEV